MKIRWRSVTYRKLQIVIPVFIIRDEEPGKDVTVSESEQVKKAKLPQADFLTDKNEKELEKKEEKKAAHELRNESLDKEAQKGIENPEVELTALEEPIAPPTPVKSFSNVISGTIGDASTEKKWFIVGASAIGKSHLKGNLPCQDNHSCEDIGNGWGIAVTCDGAGSAQNSELGSAHIANEIGPAFFKRLIEKNKWNKNNTIPTDEQWNLAVREGFEQIYHSLKRLADSRKIEISSLACTVIVVVYSPVCLLVAHIGDGRAGFCSEQDEWKSIITPHKGEEANQTIFITSNRWLTDANFSMSGVKVPECRVINERPQAFTLMTDGCETHSFECSYMNKETNKWSDPNIPYPKFFNPLVKNLRDMAACEVSIIEAGQKWRYFIEEGNKGLKEEVDDKTMLLGVNLK